MRSNKFRWLAAAGLAVAMAAMAWLHAPRSVAPEAGPVAQALRPSAAPPTAAALPAHANVSFGGWTFEGPDNIAAAAKGVVRDDVTGDMYALARDGWVYRSANSGHDWTAVDRFTRGQNDAEGFESFALDRTDGSLSLLAMTPLNGNSQRSWLRLRPGVGTTSVIDSLRFYDVLVMPAGLYRLAEDGVSLSTDDGATWTLLLDANYGGEWSNCGRLARAGNSVLVACGFYSAAGPITHRVFRSTDGRPFSLTWTAPQALSDILGGGGDAVVAPSNPNVAYLLYDRHVLRTTDRGLTWSLRMDSMADPDPVHLALYSEFERNCQYSGNRAYRKVYAVDPVNPDILWVGGLELYRSDDGGQHFGRALRADYELGGAIPWVHGLAFVPGYNGTSVAGLLVAGEQGISGTDDARAVVQTSETLTCANGETPPTVQWAAHNAGYSNASFSAADVHANGEVIASVGFAQQSPVAGAGLYYGQLGDREWLQVDWYTPNNIQIDPQADGNLFYTSACPHGLLCRWEFVDGQYQVTAKQPYSFDTDYGRIARDPSSASRVWAAQGALDTHAVRSDDGALNWNTIGPYGEDQMHMLAVSPANPNLLVGVSTTSIVRRTDGTTATTAGWTAVAQKPSIWTWWPTFVHFDPLHPNRVYAGGGPGAPALMTSNNSGVNWMAIDRVGGDDGLPNTTVRSIAVHPDNSDVVMIGTDDGLFVTWDYTNPGIAWHEVPTPFGNAPIVQIVLRRTAGGDVELHAFTSGRGLWRTTVKVLSRYADVAPDHWAFVAIQALGAAGVTSGCSQYPTRYCPQQLVPRDQMAVFLLRARHGAAWMPPTATGLFQDVQTSQWAAAWIEQLQREGITGGCATNPARYCPSSSVSRAQMAVFLLRAKHGAAYFPPAATGIFTDVPATHWAASWVEQVAREGISSGCASTPRKFCPDSSVDRAQMAAFLQRTFAF